MKPNSPNGQSYFEPKSTDVFGLIKTTPISIQLVWSLEIGVVFINTCLSVLKIFE